jgi:hypothetical protein
VLSASARISFAKGIFFDRSWKNCFKVDVNYWSGEEGFSWKYGLRDELFRDEASNDSPLSSCMISRSQDMKTV